MKLMPFDELNILSEHIRAINLPEMPLQARKKAVLWVQDAVLDILILSYVYGVSDANLELYSDIPQNPDELMASVYKEIKGKDFAQRIEEYVTSAQPDAIMRVAETDSHRVYNEGAYNTAKSAGAKFKIWRTMLDNRVRDTHLYLEGTTIPYDAEFYTYSGHKGMFPGQFDSADENCNCRCRCEYTR